uniref:Phage/plasmid primase, P4 family n=1 Tax=Roseihalotalea indica TaxID=2867963 RepID=A0AA49GMP4_9BACT|nr:phage/plasmid primase, P4 family [Tunicatimonas sp. TK19036]
MSSSFKEIKLEEQYKDSQNNAIPQHGPTDTISLEVIKKEVKAIEKRFQPVPPKEVLGKLIEFIEKVDFYERTNKDPKEHYISKAEYLVITIEKILQLAKQNRWGLCKKHDFIYVYNGAYWSLLNEDDLKAFLGASALKMGVPEFKAKYHAFIDGLYKQFLALGILPTLEPSRDTVRINLGNGTFEITPTGTKLRDFSSKDFITYQLPFSYQESAKAPRFMAYLNQVLPDLERQKVLAEFLGYVFVRTSRLKLEKTLLLYGSGANGKSVFFEIVNALLGKENFSTYSLQSLTNDTGYQRAMLTNKLVNYASEINGKLETSIFKQMVSGEPVEARLPYGKPFILEDYAKLIFNTNELPMDVEFTNAFFRRFLIIPFDVTIPEEQQDKGLASKIIQNELSGVFNWVLEGLHRILSQEKFSPCKAAEDILEQYRKEADSVAMFLEDNNYQKDSEQHIATKDLHRHYREYCQEDGYRAVSAKSFNNRLRALGIIVQRKSQGNVAYVIHQVATMPF